VSDRYSEKEGKLPRLAKGSVDICPAIDYDKPIGTVRHAPSIPMTQVVHAEGTTRDENLYMVAISRYDWLPAGVGNSYRG
jgi:hypothetical protein